MKSGAGTARIRVAYCIDSFAVGGTELNAIRSAEALDPNRFELAVIHFQSTGTLRARYEALRVNMHHMPISNLYSLSTAVQGVRFGRLLRTWGADVIHTHDLYTNIFAAPWARMIGNCRVIASRRWWFDAPRAGLGVLNRFSYRFADRVLTNSSSLGKMMHEQEKVPIAKIVEIPNFLDERAFQSSESDSVATTRMRWGLADHTFTVGMVARLVPVKNHVLLLRAAALLDSRFQFVLVGDGSSRTYLQQMSRQLGIDARVHFVGEVLSEQNLHQFFDVSVLCSLSEGFPNSILEAMASARPVVATAVGGIPEVVVDQVTGILISTEDPSKLASALCLLESDRALCQRLGLAAQQAVRSKFHRTVVMKQLSALYAELAPKPSLRRAG